MNKLSIKYKFAGFFCFQIKFIGRCKIAVLCWVDGMGSHVTRNILQHLLHTQYSAQDHFEHGRGEIFKFL